MSQLSRLTDTALLSARARGARPQDKERLTWHHVFVRDTLCQASRHGSVQGVKRLQRHLLMDSPTQTRTLDQPSVSLTNAQPSDSPLKTRRHPILGQAGAEMEDSETEVSSSAPRRHPSLALLAALVSAGTARLRAAPAADAESCCPIASLALFEV